VLLRVFHVFRLFLNSVFDQKISKNEQEEVKKQKLFFILM